MLTHADADKQAAINLFLGVDSSSTIPSLRSPRPNYRHWFTTAHLEPPKLGALGDEAAAPLALFDEYYKPTVLTQLEKLYA